MEELLNQANELKWRFKQRHYLIVFVLGFSSGLPFTLIGTTLAAWFSSEGLSITSIGLLSLVGQPYTFKFLWAPLLDIPCFKQIGKRRGWLLITQLLLIAAIISLSFFEPKTSALLIAFIALMVAFISSTQDIAVDAYRAEILAPEERGFGATLSVFSYRIATLLSGAVALVWADHFGWPSTFIALSLCLIPVIVTVYFAPEPTPVNESRGRKYHYLSPIISLLIRKNGVAVLIFIFLYKLAEAFTSTSSGVTLAFFIQALHFDLSTIGITGKGVGIIATILGSFVAGVTMMRLPLYYALFIFGVFQAVTNLLYVLLAIVGKNLGVLVIAVLFDNMSAGMGMTALIAFMMAWTHKRYTATHFAMMSAISALPRMISGPIAAALEIEYGWVGLYIIATLAALPALFLLRYLKPSLRAL